MLGILCVSIVLVAGWQAQLLLRRAGPAQRLFAFLLLGDAAVAGIAVAIASYEEELSQLLGALAVFGFAAMVAIPPILRELARGAMARGNTQVARWLTIAREHLTPGMGARQELELIEIAATVRNGEIDAALGTLRARRAQAQEPIIRQAIDERIMLFLLEARRWREAIDLFETAQAAGAPTSVPMVVEMVRAYGEAADVERAAALLAQLERSPAAGEPALSLLLWRARMLVLAFAGRAATVEQIFVGQGPLAAQPAASRAFWIGTARLFAGDRSGARSALVEAVHAARHDRQRRDAATHRLRQVDDASLTIPPSLTDETRQLADRVAQASKATASPGRLPQLIGVSWRATPATAVLIAANLVVFALVSFLLGSTEDPWALVRAGAILRPAVLSGEWWRLYASMFLHVGALHLGVNMVGLWQVGPLVEQIFGTVRYAAVYVLAGLGGAIASCLWGHGGVSAGASGALFGILGAAIAELGLARWRGRLDESRAATRWRGALLRALAFCAVANLGIGVFYPMIDQAAHVGGLVTGAVAALLVSPAMALGRSRVMGAFARVFVGVAILGALGTAAAVSATPFERTIERIGWDRRTVGVVDLDVPRYWVQAADAAVADPIGVLNKLHADLVPQANSPAFRAKLDDALSRMQDVSDIEVRDPSFPAPDRWTAREVRFAHNENGDRDWYRNIELSHLRGKDIVVLTFTVAEDQLRHVQPFIDRIVASVE